MGKIPRWKCIAAAALVANAAVTVWRRDNASLGSSAICRQGGLAFGGRMGDANRS